MLSASMTSGDNQENDPAEDALARMKSEFLAAQQRRRQGATRASLPDGTNDGPDVADPAGDGLTGIAAARP